jgi:hypothetical protein
MEERGNKTIMCSVFFLDIVGYSKKSVTGQISLKERFNSYLSTAIKHVPAIDRIILDTGDGAAINFLGDIEDALKAALSLRENLLNEDPNREHPLLVRMGINLGPVRLVRDINGQPNIVGDGINVAQRVMGFADASQILVSRSYFDAVSRVSPHYAGMFHYQGSRTDKHVREHEVYAIGYPGDSTATGRSSRLFFERSDGALGNIYDSVSRVIRSVAVTESGLVTLLTTGFWQAKPLQRLLYVLIAVIPLLVLIIFLATLMDGRNSPGSGEIAVGGQAAEKASDSAVAWDVGRTENNLESVGGRTASDPKSPPVAAKPESDQKRSAVAESKTASRQKYQNEVVRPATESDLNKEISPSQPTAASTVGEKSLAVESEIVPAKDGSVSQKTANVPAVAESDAVAKSIPGSGKVLKKSSEMFEAPVVKKETQKSTQSGDGQLLVRCLDGSEIFIDGTRKGRISGTSITLDVPTGMHAVIISHPRGVDSRNISFDAGKTVRINPDFCN